MIKPNKMKGNTVGIVTISAAESFWFPEIYNSGKNRLIELGMNVIEGRTINSNYFFLADTYQNIANDLHDMFLNPLVDFIICSGGGEAVNGLLPYLDFDLIKKNCKPFIGISDITAVLLAFLNEGIISYHGPFVLWSYGIDNCPTKYTHNNLINILNGFKGELPKTTEWKCYKTGKAEGRLIGGNTTTIQRVIATKFCPVELFDDKILILEQGWKTFDALTGEINHFKLLGIFDRIKGLVIGKMRECNAPENTEMSFIEFLDINFKDYDFPIIYDCDFGHVPDNLCLPIGANVIIEASENSKITLIESSVNN